MSNINMNELVEKISNMTVVEILELKKTLEDKWGVTAAIAAAPAAAAAAPAAMEEKTSFDVILKSAGGSKIAVIKLIREETGLGLKEAKDVADQDGSTVKAGLDKAAADSLKSKLEAAGATVELK